MTDKEKLRLAFLEIGLREAKPVDPKMDPLCFPNDFFVTEDSIFLGSGEGYSGLHTVFEFDSEGKFKVHGCFE